MEELSKYREMIDRIDSEIASLFEERMHTVKEIALIKKEKGLPVFDRNREAQMLKREREKIQDPELRDHYTEFLQALMDISKKYQTEISDLKPEAAESL